MRQSLAVLAGLLLLAAPAQAQTTGLAPAQIGNVFCMGSLAGDMGIVDGLLTDDFTAEILKAEKHSTEWAAANPGEKPPLGDGLPWHEYPDYADGCQVGTITENGDEATVTINYSFSGTPEADYANALHLAKTQVDGVPLWRISNVEFSADDSTMRQWLFEAYAFH